MTATRRRKNVRMRGSNSHGWGHKKKHRGAGSRGGRGMAGTGKRADVKKPNINPMRYFGKSGFSSKTPKGKERPITIATIIEKLPRWTSQGKAQEKDGVYQVNLAVVGYTKLLAKGKVTRKLEINVPSATPGAVERIKGAGGKVQGLLEKKAAKPSKAAKAPEKPKETEATAAEAPEPAQEKTEAPDEA